MLPQSIHNIHVHVNYLYLAGSSRPFHTITIGLTAGWPLSIDHSHRLHILRFSDFFLWNRCLGNVHRHPLFCIAMPWQAVGTKWCLGCWRRHTNPRTILCMMCIHLVYAACACIVTPCRRLCLLYLSRIWRRIRRLLLPVTTLKASSPRFKPVAQRAKMLTKTPRKR